MIKLFNTRTREIEELAPMNGNHINMFVCGQTVYDDMHLGHAKTYVNFDVIVRWLRFSGYDVTYLQNITDVDDKIIARAKESGIEPQELAEKFEARFMEDMEALGVRKNVTRFIRSHDYIPAIKDQIQLLADKGFAYFLDGDVYFDVDKFPDYTALSGMKLEDLKNHRIEPKEGKKNPYDFALWKAAKAGEPKWDIEIIFGGQKIMLSGRPGWHIEDTAMTYAEFGPQYDLHGGASELIFPHHSNEIAQAEAASGLKPFVKYWMHSGVLFINNQKMSKSLKNFIRVRDVLEKYSYEDIRFLISSTHYRKSVNYEASLIDEAKAKLGYIYSVLNMLYNLEEGITESNDAINSSIEKFRAGFTDAMDNDFNTPLAISSLMIFIGEIKDYCKRYGIIDKDLKSRAVRELLWLTNTIAILESEKYKKGIDGTARELMQERENSRKNRDFIKADELRKRINELGIEIEDSAHGTIYYFRF
ncbi:cysteine--tRNA ligase [Candidatus Marsarchaeota archaeon]|nr:cysteine--tRNA ligase [Candidatus Marsarchaeota archaeon]